jgi:hypothetical protein
VDRIREFMASQGRKAHLVLPAAHDVKKSDVALRLRPTNAELKSLTAEKAERREVLFVFKISYLCDEKREELCSVAVDAETKTARPVGNEELAAGREGDGKLRDTFPEDRMAELFNLAALEAGKHARASSREMERDMVERLHKSIERIDAYYQQLIADLPNPESVEFEKRAAEYEQEHARKRQETLENHALEIRVHLVQYIILEHPVRRFFFRFAAESADDKPKAEASVPLSVDIHNGQEFLPPCAACGHPLGEVALCRSGHAVCPACLWQCASCGKPVCPKCLSDKCHLCGARLCEDCVQRCASCGEPVCRTETTPCGVCGDPVCGKCEVKCSDCGKAVCSEHRRTCHVSGSAVCPECVCTCTHCGHAAARSSTKKCSACGQVFCARCVQSCAVCEKEFCPAHAGDIASRKMCPQCAPATQ